MNIPATAKKHPKFSIACDVDGSIYSLKTGKVRRLWKTRHGYLQIAVGRTSYLAHRLIADVHVPNPENKPLINHKNGIKDDNSAGNLEWCTQTENVRHARDALGAKFNLPGLASYNRKATDKEIRMIIRLWQAGLPEEKISGIVEYAIPTIRRYIEECRVGSDRLDQAE